MYVGVTPRSVGLPRPLPYTLGAISYDGCAVREPEGPGDARGPVAHARSDTTNPGGMCSCDG